MLGKDKWKLVAIFIIFYGMAFKVHADPIEDPCSGPYALLNIIGRPNQADSACAVPFKKALVELGYQYQHLSHSAGSAQDFPEAELRMGLPARNEFDVVLPNYIHQSPWPHSGFSALSLGLKHEIGYNQTWLAAAELFITLPNGSAAFGSKGVGLALNGIVSYTINSDFSLNFMLGGSTETQSSAEGGQRFSSINPDVSLTYSATNQLQFYIEVYGQSKTGPAEGSGLNADGGLLYLVLPQVEVDIEVGQRLRGEPDGFAHYVGAGMGILFG